jgi:ABC-2 type transport system permease protein
MRTFWTTFCKDLRLLSRDRVGLLVLFVMPVLLVLVISLIQNNILAESDDQGITLVLVDQDQGALGETLRQQLGDSGHFRLSEEADEAAAREAVASGQHQFGLLIRPGTGAELRNQSRRLAGLVVAGGTLSAAAPESKTLELFYDPTVQGSFRMAVSSVLQQVLLAHEVKAKAQALAGELSSLGGEATSIDALLTGSPLLKLRESATARAGVVLRPNAVQQNVPAWTLFGMFFIVVPLSGALIRERQEGTLQRLYSLPISYPALLAGKLSAYALLCLLQFGLMLLVGTTLLPWLGTPSLEIAGHLTAAALLALTAALAATGYGLLIGVLARSYEQASMFGAVSVVVAAALGGIMVPVYVMPKGMQLLSRFSPLGWGHRGFMEIFVRGGGLAEIVPQLAALAGLFVAFLLISWFGFIRRGRH